MTSFKISCWYCVSEFDAVDADWCGHADPTKTCPFCLRCFCDAPNEYSERFWKSCPDDLLAEKVFFQDQIQQKIGDLLLKAGKITPEQLQAALAEQKVRNLRLGEILVLMSLITRDELQIYLLNQKKVEEIDLHAADIDVSLVSRIGKEVCRTYEVVPIELQHFQDRWFLHLALGALEDLPRIKKAPEFKSYILIPSLANKDEIRDCLAKLDEMERRAELTPSKLTEAIEYFNNVLKRAVICSYSDVFVEFKENRLRILYQSNDRLIPAALPNIDAKELFRTIKRIAGISEEQRIEPQKSVVQLSKSFSHIQIRVFYFPRANEEILRMRVINLNHLRDGLSEERWDGSELGMIEFELLQPDGLFLIAGTNPNRLSELLYSIMHGLGGDIVATVETMVLARNQRFFQIEMEEQEVDKSILDSLLFHSPQSLVLFDFFPKHYAPEFLDFANAGKLFLGLHTFSYEDMFDRLENECEIPFAYLARHLRMVMFEWEINILCPHCKEIDPQGMAGRFPHLVFTREYQLFIEKGCSKCERTGYIRSESLGEVFVIQDEERATLKREDLERIPAMISELGNLTASRKAMNLVLRGEASYKEYNRFF